MNRIVSILLLCASAAASAAPCGDLRGAQVVESANYTVAFRFQPAKIAVGKHFGLDIVACGKGGAPVPSTIGIDAFMPDHGHGMNYKAAVKKSANTAAAMPGAGVAFRADGLMFHMPGRWELYFDVQSAGKTERLTQNITLE